MSHQQYQEIIASNRHLDLLINKRSISGLASFKKTSEMTDEFIDWVSPIYYESFEAIYLGNIEKNKTPICALFRAIFLANETTRGKISTLTLPFLDDLVKNASDFLAKLEVNHETAVADLSSLTDNFNHLPRFIFKHIKTPEVDERRKKLYDIYCEAYSILEIFGPRNHPLEHSAFIIFNDQIALLNGHEVELAANVDWHESNVEKKNNKVLIGIAFIVIFFLLRMIWRFYRHGVL